MEDFSQVGRAQMPGGTVERSDAGGFDRQQEGNQGLDRMMEIQSVPRGQVGEDRSGLLGLDIADGKMDNKISRPAAPRQKKATVTKPKAKAPQPQGQRKKKFGLF